MTRINVIAIMAVVTFATVVNARILGACYDENNCMICGGYSWCEALAKCVRVWENVCEENVDMADLIESKEI